MPSLSQNNGAMRLLSLMVGLLMCEKVSHEFKLMLLLGELVGDRQLLLLL